MTSILMAAMALAALSPGQGIPRPGAVGTDFLGLVSSQGTVTVDGTASGLRNTFRPRYAIGGSVDSGPPGATDSIYVGTTLDRLLTAGLGALSYRIGGELSVQAWHWNPNGVWSDPANSRGYFSGTSTPGAAIDLSHDYELPRSGFSHDQGDSNSYSRLTDGDPNSFWKSNPYLSSYYTGEQDSEHPQWVVVDLGAVKPVNAIRILWGDPYALAFDVTYWTGADPFYGAGHGRWEQFPAGRTRSVDGHNVLERLCAVPQNVRFVRILMVRSSNTSAIKGSADPRDRLGFAIRELGVGTVGADGKFHDLVVHSIDHNVQTSTTVSSVDPWHEALDVATDVEQPGLDTVLGSSLTRGLPAIVPIAMLYSTPDDAANEVAYLMARGYPIAGIELGEEPDGQFITPEDYGALYVEFARAIRKVAPNVPLGGPCLQSDSLVEAWPDSKGDYDWAGRFVSYLRGRNATNLIQFLTMEHYTLSGDQTTWANILGEPSRVDDTFRRVASYGLGIPFVETECNMSWEVSDADLTTLSAGWEADYIGQFLADGGTATYLYQYEPLPLQQGSTGWGTFSPFVGDDLFRPVFATPEFYASKLVTTEWCQAGTNWHRSYAATCDLSPVVTSYAVQRPDSLWGVMLVNKDSVAHSVKLSIHGALSTTGLRGTVTQCTFDPSVYVWHPNGADGYPSPSGPYKTQTLTAGDATLYTLPAQSVVVLRGTGP